MFSCLLFTVLFTIISIISSTILKLHMELGFFFFIKIRSHEFIGGYPFLLLLVCRYVEAEPLGTKTNVFSKYTGIQNKENYNIARGHMGYRWMNVISDCRK